MKVRSVVLVLLTSFVLSAFGEKPNVMFGPDGVTVLNVPPGTKVAWISLTRTPVAHHSVREIDRGVEIAKPTNRAEVARPGVDRSHSLWLIAAVEEDVAGIAVPATYTASSLPVRVVAAAGSPTITVISAEVELLYVRPKGGAWFLSATDGGIGDGDRVQNTRIEISLSSLERLQGNPHPPAATAAGDTILILDPRSNRTAVLKVTQ